MGVIVLVRTKFIGDPQNREIWGVNTVKYDPFIISQLASRNLLWGLVWCKSGHVMFEIRNNDIIRVGGPYPDWGKLSSASQLLRYFGSDECA